MGKSSKVIKKFINEIKTEWNYFIKKMPILFFIVLFLICERIHYKYQTDKITENFKTYRAEIKEMMPEWLKAKIENYEQNEGFCLIEKCPSNYEPDDRW